MPEARAVAFLVQAVLAYLPACVHQVVGAEELVVMQVHDSRQAALFDFRQDGRRYLVVDVVEVDDIWLEIIEQGGEFTFGFKAVDDAARGAQLILEGTVEVYVGNEIFRPRRWQVVRMLHGENSHFVAGFFPGVFKEEIILVRPSFGEIIFIGEKNAHGFDFPAFADRI